MARVSGIPTADNDDDHPVDCGGSHLVIAFFGSGIAYWYCYCHGDGTA